MCFTPEQRSALAGKLGKPADVKDDDLMSALMTDYAAQAVDLTTVHTQKTEAEKQVTALSAKLDAANAQVLTLSAAPAPDEYVIRDRADAAGNRIESMVNAGDMPRFVADKLRPLMVKDKDGKGGAAAPLMLSAAPALGGDRPIDLILSLFTGSKLGVQANAAVDRTAATLPPLSAAGGANADGTLTPEQQAEVDRSLAQTELGRRAIAARKAG